MLGAAQQSGEDVDVVRPEDGIHPRGLLNDAVSHLLGEATPDRDLHSGTLALHGGELPEVAKETGRGIFADGTGIDHDDIGTHVPRIGRASGCLGDLLDGDKAGLLQQTRHAF